MRPGWVAVLASPAGTMPARSRSLRVALRECQAELSLRRPTVKRGTADVKQLFVLFHSRGAAWDPAAEFMQQPGIEAHIAFMRGLTERGVMALGGPFAGDDATGMVGMTVIAVADAGEAERVAQEDRSIEAGLIKVSVRPWMVPMGFALDLVPKPDEEP